MTTRWCLGALADGAEHRLRRGDVAAAAGYQKEALHLGLQLSSALIATFSMILAARIIEPEGHTVQAVQLHGAADVLLDEVGFRLFAADRALSDSVLDHARIELGEDVFARELAVGKVMNVDEAIRLTDALLERATHDVKGSTTPGLEPPSTEHCSQRHTLER